MLVVKEEEKKLNNLDRLQVQEYQEKLKNDRRLSIEYKNEMEVFFFF
jgi:hypothetical protein